MKLRFVAIGTVLLALFILPTWAVAAEPQSKLFGEGTVELGIEFGNSEILPIYEPYFGYFIKDQIELGGAFYYNKGEIESNDVTVWGLDFFGRYYFSNNSWKNLIPFAEVGYMTAKYDVGDIGTEKLSRFKIGGGVKYFITPRYATEFRAYYGTGEIAGLDADGFHFNIGFSMFFN